MHDVHARLFFVLSVFTIHTEPLVFDSWYWPGFLSNFEADAIMQAIEAEIVFIDREELGRFKAWGKENVLPRDKAFMGDVDADGSFPIFRYNGGYAQVVPWSPSMRKLRDKIERATGQRCNHLVANRYKNGEDYIGYHHDTTTDYAVGAHTFTVSLGAIRKFRINDKDEKVVVDIELAHGSLNCLGWETNKDHKHAIAKTTVNKVNEVRYGLTFRTMKTQLRDLKQDKQDKRDKPAAKESESMVIDLTEQENPTICVRNCNGDGRKMRHCAICSSSSSVPAASSSSSSSSSAPPPSLPSATLKLLAELDAMVGLAEVKQQVRSFINVIEYDKMLVAAGQPQRKLTNHMVFSGNPGTGKTTVAQLVAKILKSLGVVSKGQLIEARRENLIAKYQGQSDKLATKTIETAMGGVLFIDEIDSICGSKEDTYGMEVVKVLLTAMENHRHDFVVIIAGYDAAVQKFLTMDAGLQSRFPTHIKFENYSPQQLFEMFRKSVPKFTAAAEVKVKQLIKKESEKRTCANGRFVRNLIDQAYRRRADRVVSSHNQDINTYEADDFQ